MFKNDCGACAHFEVCKYPGKYETARLILEQKIGDVSFLEIAVICKHFMVNESESVKEA